MSTTTTRLTASEWAEKYGVTVHTHTMLVANASKKTGIVLIVLKCGERLLSFTVQGGLPAPIPSEMRYFISWMMNVCASGAVLKFVGEDAYKDMNYLDYSR
ncbi:MAG: hypothetical protein AB7V18_19630 [Pyrinomonadaceae bacterium]